MRLISLGSLLGIGAIALGAMACTSGGEEDPAATGGGSGDGDMSTGDGDGDVAPGDGDGDGDGDVAADPDAVACPDPASDFVIDFTYDETADPAPSTTDGSFGDFTDTLSGGTFVYGDGLTSDVTGSEWHIMGEVADYSGFALYLNNCSLIDASAFSGIELTISGDTGGSAIQMNVGSAGNTISSAWFAANGGDDTPSHGRCEPASDNQYDGTCGSAMGSITVTDTPTTVQIAWDDLTGEKPAGSFDPAELTFIGWNFAWAGAGDTPYDVDIVIDDIKFMP